jgi:hypothetical protein
MESFGRKEIMRNQIAGVSSGRKGQPPFRGGEHSWTRDGQRRSNQTRSPLLIRETLDLKPNDDSRLSRANFGRSRRTEPKLKQGVSLAAGLRRARSPVPEIRMNSVVFAIVAD